MALTIPGSTMGQRSVDNTVAILLGAYQKHAAELLAIENSQEKLIAAILAIYSAGITVIAGFVTEEATLARLAIPMTVIALVVAGFGVYYSVGRNGARRGTRTLLVNVEAALDFYAAGAYLEGQPLYPEGFYNFPKSTFLNRGYWIILIGAAAFIAILWAI